MIVHFFPIDLYVRLLGPHSCLKLTKSLNKGTLNYRVDCIPLLSGLFPHLVRGGTRWHLSSIQVTAEAATLKKKKKKDKKLKLKKELEDSATVGTPAKEKKGKVKRELEQSLDADATLDGEDANAPPKKKKKKKKHAEEDEVPIRQELNGDAVEGEVDEVAEAPKKKKKKKSKGE